MKHVPANLNVPECDLFEFRIHELMDARQPLSTDGELEIHADSCDECFKLLAEFVELESALTELKPEGRNSIPMASSIAAPHTSTTGHDSFWNQPAGRAFAVMATIAAVLLMSTLLASNLANDRNSHASQDYRSPTPTVAPMGATFGIADAPLISGLSPNAAGPSSSAAEIDYHEAIPAIPPNGILDQHSQPILIAWGVRNLNGVSESLEPLIDYYSYSSELPGVRPLQCSLSITIDLLQKSLPWDWQSPSAPDLGAFDSRDLRPIA